MTEERKPDVAQDPAGTPRVSFALPVREDCPRLEQVIVRMPPAGKAALRRLAEKAGMPLSAFCRAVLLNVVEQAGMQDKGAG